MRSLCICSLLTTSMYLAQNKTNEIDVFKMLLFLNKKNVFQTNEIIKNDSLYINFSKSVIIKPKTLKVSGLYDYTESVYAPQFSFFEVDINSSGYSIKTNLDTIKYKYLELYFGTLTKYIIGINKNGKSYRLMGFENNDFLGFVNDYIEEYNSMNDKKIDTKQFLKNYFVEELDFNCLYKGLRENIVDRKKYPCLKRVQDPLYQ